jgi:hypothetical protein
MTRSVVVAAVLLSSLGTPLAAQYPRTDGSARAERQAAAETLLDRLVGDWLMVGEVRGRPVTYTLAARRVLGARFVELHMLDVNEPPGYEARVFIGADTLPGRILVHWLDSFGAAYSVPHGSGEVVGDTLRFEVPYPGETFRDLLIYHGNERGWTLQIEADDGAGGRRLFARYEVRPHGRRVERDRAPGESH